ncbi:MAG: STAS domain-containing protein [Firmicutes bacterium]|nr:STAS domain-containing protein [Bacillota bacterium]
MLKMDLEYDGGILFIRLKGTLSRKVSYKINNYIVPILTKHKIRKIIYNLKNLKSIDESGVDAILNTKCAVKRNKGKIYLCEVNREISLKIKRLHIKITSSEMAALKLIEV